MSVLTEAQVKKLYFKTIGGFPPQPRLKEVKEYNGENRLCIACTQLDHQGYGERDKKRVLAEWIEFLRTNTKSLTALHFNSRVPQTLFDAACCQNTLEELRFKWGAYTDLTALEGMKKLKFLYIGSGAQVRDISILGRLKSLIVLHVENFKRIEDYSPLSVLDRLEQLVISGPTLGRTPIRDLEFLKEMPRLVSLWLPGTTIRKKYTAAELADLRRALPDVFDYNGSLWGSSPSR